MPADLRIIRAIAGRWKNSDPRMYEQFLRVLDQHVLDVTVAVTEAPSSEILQAQGRAQEARKIFQLFYETLDDMPTGATP